MSRNARDYWTRDGSAKHLSRHEVAAAAGIAEPELRKWESARDIEAENEQRDEFGDY